MNVAEELDRMIAEMDARTNGAPAQIVCSQETLNQLWEQTRMIYVSEADIEEGRGYVGRYMGTPIIVSPTAEPEKLYLIPSQGAEPVRIDSAGNEQPRTFGVDFSGEMGDNNGWWLRSPFTDPMNFNWQTDGWDVEYITKQPPKTPAKEAEDIDENSFLNILKGGSNDVSA